MVGMDIVSVKTVNSSHANISWDIFKKELLTVILIIKPLLVENIKL